MIFAGKGNPIRCSKLASIAKCTARIYIIAMLDNEDDEGGPAAQTGSLTHAGVAAFHKTQGKLSYRKEAAWQAIKDHAAKFPQAETNDVRLFITPYMEDPRNVDAQILFCEQQVEFDLPPHEIDPTKERIYVEGTLDQLRVVNGVPLVDDLKTGKKTGWEMVHDYAAQIAAYTYGARQFLKVPNAQPGRIIRNYGYRVRGLQSNQPDGVFFAMPFQWDGVELILENIRMHVALIRMGQIQFNPGPHCTYCELGGLSGCIPKWNELIKLGKI